VDGKKNASGHRAGTVTVRDFQSKRKQIKDISKILTGASSS